MLELKKLLGTQFSGLRQTIRMAKAEVIKANEEHGVADQEKLEQLDISLGYLNRAQRQCLYALNFTPEKEPEEYWVCKKTFSIQDTAPSNPNEFVGPLSSMEKANEAQKHLREIEEMLKILRMIWS